MDNLEQFIKNERDQFDQGVPSAAVWANINAQLTTQKAIPSRRVKLWRFVRLAAAVLLLLVCGGAVGSYLTQQYHQSPTAMLEKISPEYVEMEHYFQRETAKRMQQLASYQKQSVVQPDLVQLDSTMEELKKELINAPRGTEEQILNNLIHSYQTKIAILERVLERVEAATSPKNNNTENEISL